MLNSFSALVENVTVTLPSVENYHFLGYLLAERPTPERHLISYRHQLRLKLCKNRLISILRLLELS